MIECGDVMEWAGRYAGPKFHALLCDPPYELGFMGKHWDKSGVVFRPETWAGLAEHLHPGAFGMAFASSRGWHRLACAIEDAGLVIHPSIFGWGFGSGFPKATRVNGAGAFSGHRYGLQAMKPALEPVIVFQKPYGGGPVDRIVETGAGALWVDGGRVPSESIRTTRNIALGSSSGGIYSAANVPAVFESHPQGRWPANFVLVHSPECADGECVEWCAVRRLGEQSGESISKDGGLSTRGRNSGWTPTKGMNTPGRCIPRTGHNDTGTAARFFFQAQWEQLEAADPVHYCAKASRKERDAGLDGMAVRVVQQGCAGDMPIDDKGTTRDRFKVACRNHHPTIKPIALIKHLATLLLPPAEYAPRRILIPFAGAGSECIGAMQAGWEEIVGIEREAEYVEIAEKRLAYWTGKRDEARQTEDGKQLRLIV